MREIPCRRPQGCDGSDLAAREAVVAPAVEPEIGVGRLGRARASEDVLQCLRRNGTDSRGVDCLPERFSQSILSTEPDCPCEFAADEGVDQRLLVAAFPDAAVVVAQNMIDTERSSTGMRRLGRKK